MHRRRRRFCADLLICFVTVSLDQLTDVLHLLLCVRTGSESWRSIRRDFTRTLDTGTVVGVYRHPTRHHRRLGCPMAAQQSPRGAQSLRHASMSSSRRPGTVPNISLIFLFTKWLDISLVSFGDCCERAFAHVGYTYRSSFALRRVPPT